jgi:hypothetical protein
MGRCSRAARGLWLQCSVPEACSRCRHGWTREALLSYVSQSGWTVPAEEEHLNGGPHTLPQHSAPQRNGVPVKS